MPRGKHTFRVGTGFHFNQLDAYQQSVMTGMQQDTFNDAQRARVGTYGEWQADWTSRWMTLLGVRNDTVISDASDIERWNPMGSAAADAAAFNAQGHHFVDARFDATAAVRWTQHEYGTYELGFARKNRAPSLLERYLWTPLSASAGLADGRTYIGHLDLDPENLLPSLAHRRLARRQLASKGDRGMVTNKEKLKKAILQASAQGHRH